MKTSDLLANTAILPAAVATARALAGAKGVPNVPLQLVPPRQRAGVRRYVEAAPSSEVQHRKPITRKTRERYQAYLVRLRRELREEAIAGGLDGDEIVRHVEEGVRTRAAPLEREVSHATPVRGTQLLDLSKAQRR